MLQPLSYDTGNDEIIIAPISYLINYSGDNITDGTNATTNSSINIILPAVDSDVNVTVTAMNVFGMGLASESVNDFISKLTIYVVISFVYMYFTCIIMCIYICTM